MNKEDWEGKYKLLKERRVVGSMSWDIDDKVIKFQSNIRQHLNPLGDKYNTIIDFGCGTAKNCEYLMSAFKIKKYIGYDIVQMVIDENKKTYPFGDFRMFENQIVRADIIWSSFCLQHLDRPNFEDTLNMFRIALNKGGLIYIINSLTYYSEQDHTAMFKRTKLKGEMLYKTPDDIAVYEVKK